MPEPTRHGIARRLKACRTRIAEAARKANRSPDDIALLAVGKNRDNAAIAAAINAGQRLFGENRVQEALPKINAAPAVRPPLEWHFIGPLQSNKTRAIAGHFAWVHSVDRASIARRLSEQRPQRLGELQVCIQVNISGETAKSGVQPAETADLLREVCDLPNLKVRGLMTVPAREPDPDKQRRTFADFRRLYESLADAYALDTLSCGMSDDFEAAIAEGATIVRIGRGIFDA